MLQDKQTITLEELNEILKTKKYVLIDVREQWEIEQGIIPTAKHIPLTKIPETFTLNENQFKEKMGFEKPTKQTIIITYCKTGVRSAMAQECLLDKDYRAFNYTGSYEQWKNSSKEE
jgi:thiosulfate:glutathione sulfurtransferase